jgi:hypothetical protein
VEVSRGPVSPPGRQNRGAHPTRHRRQAEEGSEAEGEETNKTTEEPPGRAATFRSHLVHAEIVLSYYKKKNKIKKIKINFI